MLQAFKLLGLDELPSFDETSDGNQVRMQMSDSAQNKSGLAPFYSMHRRLLFLEQHARAVGEKLVQVDEVLDAVQSQVAQKKK